MPEDKPYIPNKGKVRIKPAFLDAMIPFQWFQVAEVLAELAQANKVPDDRMRLFVKVASQIPNIPLVEGVRMLISGEIKLEMANADTVIEKPRNGLILPPGV